MNSLTSCATGRNMLVHPPPPNQQSDGFPLEFLLKGPQTELRTLSQNCEQTLQKLRTNRIMNKRAFLISLQYWRKKAMIFDIPGPQEPWESIYESLFWACSGATLWLFVFLLEDKRATTTVEFFNLTFVIRKQFKSVSVSVRN